MPERVPGWKPPIDLTYIELRELGLNDNQIAQRLGISLDTMKHALYRAGIK
jgi:DNA-directed RNA polymerase specialized sigma24 family protein